MGERFNVSTFASDDLPIDITNSSAVRMFAALGNIKVVTIVINVKPPIAVPAMRLIV
jgi:hypothetical protein